MTSSKRPNILMIMVDQMRFPRFAFGDNHGFVEPMKKIIGFQGSNNDANEYKQYFPGLWQLRENSVVLRNHRIASSACVPSRAALFTGQYGTKTGVLQTDGLFKDGADENFPWLPKKSFPTIGSYMKSAGYTSHYFGKWHISGEETSSLVDYGFSDWELSYPDPHGALPNNLGHYRDYQFADNVCAFLKRQGLGIPYSIANARANVAEAEGKPNVNPPSPSDTPTPWFAVASFTNPHDIASYPGLPGYVCDQSLADASYTLAVPKAVTKANIPLGGTTAITLNKKSFPQNNAEVAPNWNEDLINNNKPFCQFEYKYKMGLSLVAKSGRMVSQQALDNGKITRKEQLPAAVAYSLNTNDVGLPFSLTPDPELASRAFMQYYGYLISEVDEHISATLKALEDSGQAENTIIIFCPDHGEYGASHGTLMEKWHSAYEEVIHVPVVVKYPTSMHSVPNGLQQIDKITSHIDILPTILGLAGITTEDMPNLQNKLLAEGYEVAPMPVGENLSDLIQNHKKSVNNARKSVLFITHDTITEPLPPPGRSQASTFEDDSHELTNFRVFNALVHKLITDAKTSGNSSELTKLTEGPVAHPNNVHAIIEETGWKLVRYFDSVDINLPAQYELYDLNSDPNEITNLLQYNAVFPTPVANANYSDAEIIDKAISLLAQLKTLEVNQLGQAYVTEKLP